MELETALLVILAIFFVLELISRWAESVRNKRKIQTLKSKQGALECASKYHSERINELVRINRELERENIKLADKIACSQFTFEDDGTITGYKGHLKLATQKFEKSIGHTIDSVKISKVTDGYQIDIHL